MNNYILEEDHSTRPEANREEGYEQYRRWADAGKFVKGHPKVVDKTELPGNIEVSTVFLGLDHSFYFLKKNYVPILFETMVRGGEHDQWQDRYATWDEAQAGHDRVVAALQRGESPCDDCCGDD